MYSVLANANDITDAEYKFISCFGEQYMQM